MQIAQIPYTSILLILITISVGAEANASICTEYAIFCIHTCTPHILCAEEVYLNGNKLFKTDRQMDR